MAAHACAQEAEAGELLESGRRRLQGAKIVPLHSSLGDGARLHLKKKVNKIKTENNYHQYERKYKSIYFEELKFEKN